MNRLVGASIFALLLAVSASASAWWGAGPWNSLGDNFGDAWGDGHGDFSLRFSTNSSSRLRSKGYGYGYAYEAPYQGPPVTDSYLYPGTPTPQQPAER